MFTGKFKVHSVMHLEGDNAQVVMSADTNSKSDYAKYTPSGKIEFMCTNPEVNKQLVPGKMFTVTFSE